MKKQWRKACITVLTIGLLTFGIAGCSGVKIFGIQIGGNNENNEEFDFSQLTNKYPIPDPIRTPEEIKAAGGEVTTKEVVNAFEYFTYKVATDILGESEVVSSKFISITPIWHRTQVDGNYERVYDSYYVSVDNKCYSVCLNIIFAAADSEFSYEYKMHVPKEDFEKFLVAMGADRIEVTEENYKKLLDEVPVQIGYVVFPGDTFDLTKIDELEPEEKEVVISFFNDLSKDIKKLKEVPNPAPGHENN